MKPFRFGIAIAATEPPDAFIGNLKLAEELGFDSIWIPEFRMYFDIYVSLALAALNTSRVRLGCAVTNPYTRHPGMIAVGIASVDSLSGGRAALGLGAGGIVLNLLQIERRRPVRNCRQAIEAIYSHLGRQGRSSKRYVQLDLPTRADLPILVGATGREMLALAGEIADGVIINIGAHPGCLESALAAVETGARRAGRSLESLEKLCWLKAAVSEDPREAIDLIKPSAALTLGRLPNWALETMEMDVGHIREIHKVYHTQGAEAAASLVSDEMVSRFTIAGTPARAIGELQRLRQLGFDEFVLIVEDFGGNLRSAMKDLAEKVTVELKKE